MSPLSSSAPTRTIEPRLATFKKGDDLAHCLREARGDVRGGLQAYATLLRRDAEAVEHLVTHLASVPATALRAEAGTHYIGLTVPATTAQALVDAALASFEEMDEAEDVDEFDDELDDDFDDDFDDEFEYDDEDEDEDEDEDLDDEDDFEDEDDDFEDEDAREP